MSQKSYNGTPSVYLIPTPIGNLDDITLRAIKTLEQVEVIFSEDTRVTSMLLQHLNIKKKLISSHQYNEAKNSEKLLFYLKEGYDVGIVSDRGTPVISDPGYELVKIAISSNYNVIALPGPTALIPALITSGITPMPFLFYGFLNNKEGKRKKELEKLKSLEYTLIFYEAPHRIEKTLINMSQILGNRMVSISREISKKYEEIYRGRLDEVLRQIVDIKGEIVIILEGNLQGETHDNLTLIEQIEKLICDGMSVKDAIKQISLENNISKNEVYQLYHRSE